MPRPGQKRNRTLAALAAQEGASQDSASGSTEIDMELDLGDEDDDQADDGMVPGKKAGQALPVAVIPDDFDGDPEDGATYLALAKWVSPPCASSFSALFWSGRS